MTWNSMFMTQETLLSKYVVAHTHTHTFHGSKIKSQEFKI